MNDFFPSTWGQYYAHCYGQMDHLLEDFLDGILSARDLRTLYNEVHDRHFSMLQEMVKRTAKGDPAGTVPTEVRSPESPQTP